LIPDLREESFVSGEIAFKGTWYMKNSYRSPNINDIAKEAGVSKSTVSRALADAKNISEETKRRICTIKDRLGYEPNNIARGLSIKKTHTIGVLLEDISNSFYTEMAKGIEVTLKKAGYTMFLASTDFSCEEEIRLTKTFIQNGVDGILITLINEHSEVLNVLKKRELPFFVLNGKPCDESINWIDTDNRMGGYLQAKHLIDIGHRKFIILRSTQLEGSRDRFAGIVEALKESGLSIDDQTVLGDANTREEGFELIKGFLGESQEIGGHSAVIATNDIVAIGAMEYLFEKGIRVPGDISVIGYDDIAYAPLIRVPLTTIHQAKFTMGEIAAYMLVNIIEGQAQSLPQQYLLKPHLIIRESTRSIV